MSLAPRVVCMTGPSGCGKSTVARRLAQLASFSLISSSELRKMDTKHIWGRMYQAGLRDLNEGKRIILDATFLTHQSRWVATDLSKQFGLDPLFVEVVTPTSLLFSRTSKPSVAIKAMLAKYDPPPASQTVQVCGYLEREMSLDLLKVMGRLLG